MSTENPLSPLIANLFLLPHTWCSSPKPVFHVHGKKTAIHSQKSQTGRIDPQHKELVKYIHETWKCVKKEYESDGVASATACLAAADKSAKSAPRRPSLVTKSKESPFRECNPFVFSNCFTMF